jgi:iron complex outermembrane receptor protein
MRILIIAIIGIFQFQVIAQGNECHFTLQGQLKDEHSKEIIPFFEIKMKENGVISKTDSLGNFEFKNLCEGKKTLIYHSLNKLIYTEKEFLISENQFVNIEIENHFENLSEVLIEAHHIKKQEIESLQKNEISGLELEKSRGLSLGESLKSITGVNSIQTGPSISKPMIHGMYGNRVLLLNNGVRLEGQNWGADHAPEIDPFIATKLSVIKGAASIRYGMDALAGVILVEPKEMPLHKTVRGEFNVVGSTNGRSGVASSYLEGRFDKKLAGLSWRVQGTLKEAGAYKTPTYYLTNTAMNESNYSAGLCYNKKKFDLDVYYSSFNSKVGIYSGSSVGNLTDLMFLFNSSEPIVPSYFSYSINRGYQTIKHDLLKVKGCYHFQKAGNFTYILARQSNKREEFEQGVSFNQAIVDQNIPDAYFQLITNSSDVIYEHRAKGNFSGSMGVNFSTQGNVFKGLDFKALIPNFRTYSGGIFLLEKWNKNNWTVEAGVRYDYKWMRSYIQNYSKSTTYSTDNQWQNTSATLGSVYKFNKQLSLNSSFGIGWRPPAPIELYALGIHQSAASFEIGDTTLKAEKSYNLQSYLNFSDKKLSFEIGGYFNTIDHFIYLKPLLKPIVTISGTYPAFQYTQANVFYTGLDVSFSYDVHENVEFTSKSALIYTYNRTLKDYLINTPSNRFNNGIIFKKDHFKKLSNLFFEFSTTTVLQQKNVPLNSDYVLPPQGYFLMNIDLGTTFKIKNQEVAINFSVNNLANTVYRDYLNRFRYYSNELGRNFTLRIKVPFSIFNSTNSNE